MTTPFNTSQTEEVLASVLDLFVSDDETRIELTNPFSVNGFVIATDARSMVWFEKNLYPNLAYSEAEDLSVYLKYIQEDVDFTKTLSIDELDLAISKIELIEEIIEIGTTSKCKECEGGGEVKYEYKNYSQKLGCPVCMGDGEIEDIRNEKTGKMIHNEDQYIKINDITFSIRQLLRLQKVANILGVSHLKYSKAKNRTNPTTFLAEFVKILVMPVANIDNYLDVAYCIK